MDSCPYVVELMSPRQQAYTRCKVTKYDTCLYHESKSYSKCPILTFIQGISQAKVQTSLE